MSFSKDFSTLQITQSKRMKIDFFAPFLYAEFEVGDARYFPSSKKKAPKRKYLFS